MADITNYKGFQVLDEEPTGNAGQALQANFKATADFIEATNAALTDLDTDLATLGSQVGGLAITVAGKADTSTLSSYVTSTALTTTLGSYATSAALSSGLSGKANSTHTHAISDVTGLQTALNGKADTSSLSSYVTTASLTTGLAGKANTTHTHAQSDVTGLTAALAAKADSTSLASYLKLDGTTPMTGNLTFNDTFGSMWGSIQRGSGGSVYFDAPNGMTLNGNTGVNGSMFASGNITTSGTFNGSGANLTGLTKTQVGLSNVPNVDTTNASNITSGTLSLARFPDLSAATLYVANVNASGVMSIGYSANVGPYHSNTAGRFGVSGTSGEFSFMDRGQSAWVETPTNGERYVMYATGNTWRIWSGVDLVTVNKNGLMTATGFSGSGASLTSLNASNISSGTIGYQYLPQTITRSAAGPTLVLENTHAWDDVSFALKVNGYADINGFRINGNDGQNGLYSGPRQIGFAANNGWPMTFTHVFGGGERMRIHGDGKVGIGTSTPFYPLDVAGQTRLQNGLVVNGDIQVGSYGSMIGAYDANGQTGLFTRSEEDNEYIGLYFKDQEALYVQLDTIYLTLETHVGNFYAGYGNFGGVDAGELYVSGGANIESSMTIGGNITTNGSTTSRKFVLINGVLTDGATINWNLSNGNTATVTLGGNRTLANPTFMAVGHYTLKVTQDGTGNRSLTYGTAYKWSGGVAPTLSTTAGAVDVISFYCDGTNMYGSILRAFA